MEIMNTFAVYCNGLAMQSRRLRPSNLSNRDKVEAGYFT